MNEQDQPSKKVIQSYIYHKDKCFFVSTIERTSSAQITPTPRFNETIVWMYNSEKNEREEMVYQDGDSKGSLSRHQAICLELYETGKVKDDNDIYESLLGDEEFNGR
jgi:hypothetical protein